MAFWLLGFWASETNKIDKQQSTKKTVASEEG